MNFKNFICNNCEVEKEDDSYFFFKQKNSKEIKEGPKVKNTDMNIKSVLSTSDNNNSMNYGLEIIEYPYSFPNNEYSPIPQASSSQINIENKKKYLKYENYINKISPLIAGKNKENKYPKNLNLIETNLEIQKLNELTEIMINNENNNTDRKETPNNSSLINNEDSIMNHKAFIDNYNSNTLKNKNNNSIKNEKNIINHNKKMCNKINEVKVDYPCPDSDFFMKNNNVLNTKSNKEKSIIRQIQSQKDINNKIETKQNEIKDNKIKVKLSSKNINLKKTKYNKYINIKNNAAYALFMKNRCKKTKNKIPIKINKTENYQTYEKLIVVNVSNKQLNYNKKLKNLKEIEMNSNKKFIFSMKSLWDTNTFDNKYMRLQTENPNKDHIRKVKSKHLPCVAIDDLLFSKNTLKYRNTLSNFKDKKKSINTVLKINTSKFNDKISKNRKQSNNYSFNIYSNPFSAVYKRNKKM